MDKSYKSNWAYRALFLLAISLFSAGFFTNPSTTASETIVPVPATEIKIEQIVPVPATDVPSAVAQTQTKPASPTPNQPTPIPVIVAAPAVKPAPPIQAPQTIEGFSLRIDAIGINIPLGKTGLDAQGHLMVPANGLAAAWYKAGPVPGNSGTALITGHYDYAGGKPGVFYKLDQLKPGNVIQVGREDGSVAVFQVDKLASYRQDDTFPWNLVYSASGPAALRIITCDGTYNPSTGLYSHNLVVYASLAN
jgi:sortase (surface protein transpeptidase)